MKKFFMLTIILLFSLCLLTYNFYNEFSIDDTSINNIKIKPQNMLSIMLESSDGSGNYVMTTQNSWPTDGYVFNSELSKCENGGTLSWDKTNKKVLFEGNNIDKCYVYFDVVKPMPLAEYVVSQYTGTQGVNGIYYHNSSLTNGAGDNSYRYAGASDQVNNYVCFGSSETPCPADNLYRIIGVFGDRVKLIKSDYATSALLGTDGDYKQAYTAAGFGSSYYKGNNLANIAGYNWNKSGQNTWSLSNLNKTNLNQNFITKIGTEWSNKIDMTTWKVGGNTYDNISRQPAKTAYQNEIVNPVTTNSQDNKTEYSAKIGLMYASDYGFAAAPSAWTANLNTYNGEAIKNVNWMYMGLHEWTISRYADLSSYAFSVHADGGVTYNFVDGPAIAVRPVFNLSSSVNYVSGSGSATDPITIN